MTVRITEDDGEAVKITDRSINGTTTTTAISNNGEEAAAVPVDRRPSSVVMRRRSSVIVKLLDKSVYTSTTEEIHGNDDQDFFGPYAHLRKLLDYSWYKNYTQQRQWLQDAIIEDLVENVGQDDGEDENGDVVCVTPTEPWLIFTIGARGAGKAHTMRQLVREGRIPLLSYVHVDPDYIRRRLPEFKTYAEMGDVVNNYTRKEAGLISELVLLAALQSGRNVVFDSTMRNTDWFLATIEKFRLKCGQEWLGILPTLKIGLIQITAPNEVILERAALASQITGRIISEDAILASLDTIPASLEAVIPHVDFYCEIQNNKNSYEHDNLDDVYQLVQPDDGNHHDLTWDTLYRTFSQCCAWKPGMKAKTPTRREWRGTDTMTMRRSKFDRKPFDVLISSEENNKSDTMHFYGKYAHLRRTLDYSYHCNYTFERQKLQDAIIGSMLDAVMIEDADGNVGTVPTLPFVVFTAGAMGAGKSHSINLLVEKGRFPLQAFVVVDPDEIRRVLPEYHIYIEQNQEEAGNLTRKESGFIAEILTLATLQSGKNCIVDGSLRDCDWYIDYFKRLHEEYPAYMQAIIHVTAPREAVFARAAKRAELTGRVVPKATLENALRQVPESVAVLKHHVEYYAEINNPPNADDVELVEPKGSTWDDFRRQWNQSLAFVSNKERVKEKQEKAKCKLRKVSSSINTSDEEDKTGKEDER